MTLCFLRKASLSGRGLIGNEVPGTVTPSSVCRGTACAVADCHRTAKRPSLTGAARRGKVRYGDVAGLVDRAADRVTAGAERLDRLFAAMRVLD